MEADDQMKIVTFAFSSHQEQLAFPHSQEKTGAQSAQLGVCRARSDLLSFQFRLATITLQPVKQTN